MPLRLHGKTPLKNIGTQTRDDFSTFKLRSHINQRSRLLFKHIDIRFEHQQKQIEEGADMVTKINYTSSHFTLIPKEEGGWVDWYQESILDFKP